MLKIIASLLFSIFLSAAASAQSCGSLPNTLANGTNADATQVMANFNVLLNCANSSRQVLTASRTYYVRTDGNDSNNGLTNSSSGAFLTIQRAINAVAALDISTFNVTVNVADGTYTGAIVVNGAWLGSGTVSLIGNTSTPSNVVVNVTGNALIVQSGGRLSVGGFKFISTAVGTYAYDKGTIIISAPCEWGANASYNVYADTFGAIRFDANPTFSGTGGFAAIGVQTFGTVNIATRTLTVSGTPAFTSSFASSSLNGLIVANGFSFTGSGATGSRYSATTGGGIFTFGGGANIFPGSSAGSATSPGWYN